MQPFAAAAAAAVRPQGYGRTLTWLPASIICNVVVAPKPGTRDGLGERRAHRENQVSSRTQRVEVRNACSPRYPTVHASLYLRQLSLVPRRRGLLLRQRQELERGGSQGLQVHRVREPQGARSDQGLLLRRGIRRGHRGVGTIDTGGRGRATLTALPRFCVCRRARSIPAAPSSAPSSPSTSRT